MGGLGMIKAKVLRTAGIGESMIDARITDLMTWNNPTVGLAAHTGQTDIRITARADTEAEADRMIAEAEQILQERVGEFVYGTDKELLEDAFMRMLNERGLKLAVSYSGPGGSILSERLHHEGSYADVVIAEAYEYDLNALLARLNRSADDVISDYCELSRAEAKRLCEISGADVVIAIVTHETGTGITSLTQHEERSRSYHFGGVDNETPIWAGTWGMSMAWRLVRQAGEI
jgi:nicotinamide-nucleotide amidase